MSGTINAGGYDIVDNGLLFSQNATGALCFGFCAAVLVVLSHSIDDSTAQALGKMGGGAVALYSLYLARKAKELYRTRGN